MATELETGAQWDRVHGAVKQKYGQITDDELREVQGDSEQLIGLIQRKVGAARSDVEAFVRKVYEDCGAGCSHLAQQASEYAEATGEKLRQGYEQSTRAVARHPMESVAMALGIGLLAGIAIGFSLAADRRREPTWRERWTGR